MNTTGSFICDLPGGRQLHQRRLREPRSLCGKFYLLDARRNVITTKAGVKRLKAVTPKIDWEALAENGERMMRRTR